MVFEIHGTGNPRLRLFLFVFAAMFCLLIAGLAYRQLVLRSQYVEEEKLQSQRRILLPAPRGNIYDREGNLLVANRPVFSAVVYLHELKGEFRKQYFKMVREARERDEKPNRTFLQKDARRAVVQSYLDQINAILGTNEQVTIKEVERHFWQTLLLPMPLFNNLEPEQYAKLVEQIPVSSPIQINTDSARYYPQGSIAAHTLGFVKSSFEDIPNDIPGDELTTFKMKGKTGITGLEYGFNDHLRGDSGYEIWVVDPFGYKFEPTEKKQPVKGNDLRLSLDTKMQRVAEDAIGNRKGAAVVIKVDTGEVLTLADKPDYNLEDFFPYLSNTTAEQINENEAWQNRAVQLPYPPGSTFKVFVAAAGLKHDIFEPNFSIQDTGSMRIGGRTFRNYDGHAYGVCDLRHALVKSSNIYFYTVGLKAGHDILGEEAIRFGFDVPTGIELPKEETHYMNVPDEEWKRKTYLDDWFPGDTANMAIGQGGVSVTPLQMACFTASFARRETRTIPTLMYNPNRPHSEVLGEGEPIGLEDSDYQAILDGMEGVLGSQGTARKVAIPGLRIAGKTGTAQFRAHGEELTLAWFIAFAPIENPEIAICTFIEGESGERVGGGSTAGPIAKALLETYFGGSGNIASN